MTHHTTCMRRGLLALASAFALSTPLSCAAEAGEPAKAVEAILTACTTSASTGKPVDTAGLLPFFEWDAKKELFTSIAPLPRMGLIITDKSEIRCSLVAGLGIVKTDFAPAVAKALMGWPRLERKDREGKFPMFSDPGDAKSGLHQVAVINEVEGGLWQLRVWDLGLPK